MHDYPDKMRYEEQMVQFLNGINSLLFLKYGLEHMDFSVYRNKSMEYHWKVQTENILNYILNFQNTKNLPNYEQNELEKKSKYVLLFHCSCYLIYCRAEDKDNCRKHCFSWGKHYKQGNAVYKLGPDVPTCENRYVHIFVNICLF